MVAVGRAGRRPIAWTSSDGSAWTEHDVPVIGGPTDWERMTVVASGPLGLLAGGSVGPELYERRARFWRSSDGASWTPVADDPGFDGAEVSAILPVADGWLALGRLGTGQRTTGSLAWRSPDGAHWTRIDDPDLARGWVRAVAQAPDGSLVAVGSEPDEIGAYAWRSTDGGRTWSLAPEEPSRTWFGRKIRMTDVTTTPTGFLAVGNLVELQFGTGQSWLSADGIHWDRSPNQPPMGQVEPSAVVGFGDRYVMVGTFGAPDNYIPRAWISPPGASCGARRPGCERRARRSAAGARAGRPPDRAGRRAPRAAPRSCPPSSNRWRRGSSISTIPDNRYDSTVGSSGMARRLGSAAVFVLVGRGRRRLAAGGFDRSFEPLGGVGVGRLAGVGRSSSTRMSSASPVSPSRIRISSR